MSKLPILNTRKLVKILYSMGFYLHHQVGSHAQFKHPDGRRTTIPIHLGKDIAPGTLKAVLRDIEISVDELTKAL